MNPFESSSSAPVVEVRDLSLTMINDPIEILVIEGAGRSDVAGPVKVSARVNRRSDAWSATVEMPGIPVGPELIQRLSTLRPEMAVHFGRLTARGAVRAVVAVRPGASPALHYDVMASLSGLWQAVQIIRPDGRRVADIRPLVRLSVAIVVGEDDTRALASTTRLRCHQRE